MLITYLEFGKFNCFETFMVMSTCHPCAFVIFVDFSEYSCWYFVFRTFYGIKLINALLLNV